MTDNNENLGKVLKRQRLLIPLTLRELSIRSGVSASHLCRIEREERYPSARILRKLSKPFGFEENELFTLAGYLSHGSPIEADSHERYSLSKALDPYVATVLSQEPVETQRTVIGILSILRNLAKNIKEAYGYR